ncbi:MAG: hypothetical protein M3036_11035, partial [Bifidobacteriales bacterium]|nr:hypothetical protein [Bifidobacteriales bacterium]
TAAGTGRPTDGPILSALRWAERRWRLGNPRTGTATRTFVTGKFGLRKLARPAQREYHWRQWL